MAEYNALGAAKLLARPELRITSPSVTILGIDPGLTNCGWGLIEQRAGMLMHLGHGVIKTEVSTPRPQRLYQLTAMIAAAMRVKDCGESERVLVDEVAIEDIAWGKNVISAFDVARACGAIEAHMGDWETPVTYYANNEVKLAVTGAGRADKVQVQEMVKILLGLPDIPKPDHAADALAVAVTHALRRG